MISSARVRVPLVVVTALIFQLTLLARIRVAGVMPDLMLLLAVAGGITGGEVQGAVVGFASGLVIDPFLQTPMGLSALVFTLVGYAVGTAQTGILRSSWWIPVLTAFVASAGGELLFALAAALVGRRGLITGRLGVIVAVVGATNALLSPLVVRVMSWAVARGPRTSTYVV